MMAQVTGFLSHTLETCILIPGSSLSHFLFFHLSSHKYSYLYILKHKNSDFNMKNEVELAASLFI